MLREPIQLGKYYKCKNGQMKGPMIKNNNLDYPFRCELTNTIYSEKGEYVIGKSFSQDLIEIEGALPPNKDQDQQPEPKPKTVGNDFITKLTNLINAWEILESELMPLRHQIKDLTGKDPSNMTLNEFVELSLVVNWIKK